MPRKSNLTETIFSNPAAPSQAKQCLRRKMLGAMVNL
jgi:hypothetical protein